MSTEMRVDPSICNHSALRFAVDEIESASQYTTTTASGWEVKGSYPWVRYALCENQQAVQDNERNVCDAGRIVHGALDA